jgi:hypothetical protein
MVSLELEDFISSSEGLRGNIKHLSKNDTSIGYDSRMSKLGTNKSISHVQFQKMCWTASVTPQCGYSAFVKEELASLAFKGSP